MAATLSILELLQKLDLTHYWSNFHRHGIGVRQLSHLNLSDLMAIGINNASDRLLLLKTAKEVTGIGEKNKVIKLL